MVVEGDLAVKLHAKDGTSSDRNPRQDQVTGLTVKNLLTTNAVVLLGFSILHEWLHHSWILAKSLLADTVPVGMML